ncbi:MAG: NADH-quinone oxidoreductase subunit C [Sphingomonadales bacterium]|nr:MAG: NADH-quinone oxidoreductase subunit C [Sphingomonadales bacterium]
MRSAAPRMIDRDDSVWAPLLGDGVTRRPGVEVAFNVPRARLLEVIDRLRVEFEYQQLMEIAGADYPERAERFDVVYCLLSLTKNHRIRVHVTTDEVQAVPSVTQIWPVAGWLEREVYDMYGVLFDGNDDLRRILTDYGFVGHPLRKDFPQTGYVELRYSEEAKRVVYEPVKLAQDFRSFDFMSPWEGAQYVLPGDEKAATPPAPQPEAKGAPTPLKADEISKSAPAAKPEKAKVTKPKTSDSTAQTGAGKPGPDAGPAPAKKPRKPSVKKTPEGKA